MGGAGMLELWGGVECSVVRIGDAWRDQVRETGHDDRADADLDRLRALGIRRLRYPVLWERCAPGHPQHCGWDWHDARLHRMAELGIEPILGLLHHGSGPADTHLLDAGFAQGLAGHAGRAAERYGHVRWWTPLNEPQTTARFSCLYGHWYPHQRNEDAFLRAVVNQCRAILLAVRAIRAHIPDARFVHTEDMGRVFATRPLRRQEEYENARRWLSLDLLCGRVDHAHPWRARLEEAGGEARILDELRTGEARPDLLGINHYVTSDRFLDHRRHLYPPHLHPRDPAAGYVDTEAARVPLPLEATGWLPRLREVWERYGLPMAVTEAHLGCADPREQLRWLMQAWNAAKRLRAEGADIRAITAWALFGLVDWDSMLRERRNHYEPGAFDGRHAPPRPTPLVEALRHLAQEGRFTHPALKEPGWWERGDRVPAAMRHVSAA